MRILVLGSTGFLGGHIAGHLRALPGVEVSGGSRSPAADLTVDLAATGVDGLAAALRALSPQAVINCAGAVTGSPLLLSETNARGPAVLCEAMRQAVPGARLVHLGSAAEYGATAAGRTLTESSPACPPGLYGATKLAGTLGVAEVDLDAVVLRVFNPVGPGAPSSGLPGRLAGELRRQLPDGTVRVGDLSAHRDFVDARDVARAAALAAIAPGPLPRVLNIGSGTAAPVRAIADGLLRVSGFAGRIEESGQGSERSAAVSWQQADVSAAAAALGWRPELDLMASLTDLWTSLKDLPAGEAG